MKKRVVIDLPVTCFPYADFVKKLVALAEQKTSSYTCVANVHMCIEAHDDPTFREVVNQADMVTPDGMPLAKAIKLLYGENQERVAGMDLLPDLLKEAERENISVFFYGGTQAMLDQTALYCGQHFPQLNIAGLISPPFRALTPEEDQQYVLQINNSNAGFVFVALGCPKQEKWMASMKGKINACMIGIGGALPVMVGMQARAPKWMQDSSLEWLYRFIQEPKRLFKRYAYTNSKFLYLLAKQFFRKRR